MKPARNPAYDLLSSLADREGALAVSAEFPRSASNRTFHGRPPEWRSVLRGIHLLARLALLAPLTGDHFSIPGFRSFVPSLPSAGFARRLRSAPLGDAVFLAAVVPGRRLSYAEFDRRRCQPRAGGGFTNLLGFEAKAAAVSKACFSADGAEPSLSEAAGRAGPFVPPPGVDLSGVAYAPELLEDVASCCGAVLSARLACKSGVRKKKGRNIAQGT